MPRIVTAPELCSSTATSRRLPSIYIIEYLSHTNQVESAPSARGLTEEDRTRYVAMASRGQI
ncbi:hypothetical protein BQ8482_360145 [Mesorhizobium delmotii]|uniref:Uncharacterized protein n=1 Tax=Mesorhizobium delmotii TaxID=1631247 RepID=A0A2P9ARI6_9HYPH|nr:hypothetical protein BQ8482_360145 [Mesorhizobium delmotii]